jgi:hypothetical protein|tara:strand:- start:44 stop:709 length:666 start_codon:yes stop_codon:yes gene_type:complete
MISKGDALLILRPGAKWNVLGGKIEWLDTEQTQPTEEEIVQKIAELKYTEEVEEYKKVRELAYPSSGEQFDKIFHEGIDAWKVDIQAIKDAHPKAEIDETVLASRKALALFNHQLEEYTTATARLAQYVLSVGRAEVIETRAAFDQVYNEETFTMDDVMTDFITVAGIDALDATAEVTTYDDEEVATTATVENPLITQDNAERAAAQAIVDATPQAVKDAA